MIPRWNFSAAVFTDFRAQEMDFYGNLSTSAIIKNIEPETNGRLLAALVRLRGQFLSSWQCDSFSRLLIRCIRRQRLQLLVNEARKDQVFVHFDFMKVLHMHGDFFLRGTKIAAKGAGELLWQDNIVILNRLTKIRF